MPSWPVYRSRASAESTQPRYTYSQYQNARPAAGTGSQVTYCSAYAPSTCTTRLNALRGTFNDQSWYDSVLREPIALSTKQHTSVGRLVKATYGLDAARAARQVLSPFWTGHTCADLNAAFLQVPASRRRAVVHALQKLGSQTMVARASYNTLKAVAELLARRPQATLERDVAVVCKLASTNVRLEVTPSILAWLRSVPEEHIDAAVQQGLDFLPARATEGHINAFCRSATAIGAAHLGEACRRVLELARAYYVSDATSASMTLLVLAAKLPHAERRAWFDQVIKGSMWWPIGTRLEVAYLLATLPAAERHEVAEALYTFFSDSGVKTSPTVMDLPNNVEALPADRRALYLRTFSGCLKAASKPLHQPNEVAVAALTLYQGYIDHRHGIDDAMVCRVSRTLTRFMALGAPEKEALQVMVHAKALAQVYGNTTPDLLESMANALVAVAPAERERFVALAPQMSEGAPEQEDRVNTTRLLAQHPADLWSTLQEACLTLQNVGLPPSLVADGVQAVLKAPDAVAALDASRAFLNGGLASAARAGVMLEHAASNLTGEALV